MPLPKPSTAILSVHRISTLYTIMFLCNSETLSITWIVLLFACQKLCVAFNINRMPPTHPRRFGCPAFMSLRTHTAFGCVKVKAAPATTTTMARQQMTVFIRSIRDALRERGSGFRACVNLALSPQPAERAHEPHTHSYPGHVGEFGYSVYTAMLKVAEVPFALVHCGRE